MDKDNIMKKIVNLTLENRFIYYFPIDFDLKKLNQLKPKFIGESAEDFIQYLFNNVFINPSELAMLKTFLILTVYTMKL